jgi:alanine dehydrogenase
VPPAAKQDATFGRRDIRRIGEIGQAFESARIRKVVKDIKDRGVDCSEWLKMRPGQILFTFFHFAASEALTRGVLETGATAVAYETLRGKRGDLPCLSPTSEVAGRMGIQEGAKYLERPQEGRGILLSGVPGAVAETFGLAYAAWE